MTTRVEIKPRAVKDMRSFPEKDRKRILQGIEELEGGLTRSVKRLTNFHPQYRLRVGNYRVLFNIEGETAVIYRVKLRKDAYRRTGESNHD